MMSNENQQEAEIKNLTNWTDNALDGLSEAEKKVALEILKQYSEQGKSNLLDQMAELDFEEIPVSIDTFLHDQQYLGRALYDGDGRFTLFPFWEQKLKEIFPDNLTTAYNTIVFTGAIGLGKTLVADICLLYLLYRLLCLKNPYLYYGMQEIDKISISLLNITLDNARGVALDKLNQMILSSTWFMAHGEMSGTANLNFHPNKHIEIIVASSNNQVIGRAIFANFADECNFGIGSDVEKLKRKQKVLISQIDARMKSRFMRTKKNGLSFLPTLNIIASSKNSEQSFLDEYIEMKKRNESTTTLIVDEPQWTVDSRKDSNIKFWVAIGNKFLANELLPLGISAEDLDKWRAKGYSLLAVPIGYLDNFQDNIDGALCDIAGIATASSLKYISGERLNETKVDAYKNPFTRDIIEVGNAPADNVQYSNFFDLSAISAEDFGKPLFIHLDMSVSGDKTGIAGVWITGKQAVNQSKIPSIETSSNQHDMTDTYISNNTDDSSRDLQYKLAFSVSIKAPKGYQISFEKNRTFIRWLRAKGFAVKGVSSDSFQSIHIQQELHGDGFNTSILSVDRVDKVSRICLPYQYFKSAIYERRIQIYRKCDLLTEEIVGLEKLSDGHINHPDNGTHGSKDQCDAFCGALFLASKFSDEYSYSFGDNICAALEANDSHEGDYHKQQMITDFEAELTKISLNYNNKSESSDEQDQENSYFADIADGILNI